MIEQPIQHRRIQTLLFQQIEQNPRIDISGACSHHQPFQWCKSHRRIDTFPRFDRRRTRTVSKMQRNQITLHCLFPQQLSRLVPQIVVRKSVKTVTTNIEFKRHRLRQCISIRNLRHTLMKRRIKQYNLRRAGRELHERFDPFEIGGIV